MAKNGSAPLEVGVAWRDPGDEMCWHQCQFARLRLCKRRLDASDEAMARGDYAEAVAALKEELKDESIIE